MHKIISLKRIDGNEKIYTQITKKVTSSMIEYFCMVVTSRSEAIITSAEDKVGLVEHS